MYCADVAGAFDRVDAERLVEKLQGLGVPHYLVKVLKSWLQPRGAQVILEGVRSRVLKLANMVFQGTVLGPPLWNAFYADCRTAVVKCGFQDLFFADDLNCWKTFSAKTSNSELLDAAGKCQEEVHTWGTGNRVLFDTGKESRHVLSHTNPEGGNCKVLGVEWDTKLLMHNAAETLVRETK